MAENKPDSKLVSTPMEYLCGNPDDKKGGDVTTGGVEIEGAPKESTSEGIETVTLVNVPGAGKGTLA